MSGRFYQTDAFYINSIGVALQLRKRGSIWEKLEETIARKELQGIIAITPDAIAVPWLEHLNVPVSYFTSLNRDTDVSTDSRQFMRLSIEHLYQHGCKNMALLLGYRTAHIKEAFLEVCNDLGLKVPRSHLIYPSDFLDLNLLKHWGYEQFTKLIKSANRPDGFVIYDDVIARGAIMGALVTQVDIPNEVKLVIQSCAEIPFLCPLPASFVECSCAEVAAAIFQQLQRLFRGEPTKKIFLPYRHALR